MGVTTPTALCFIDLETTSLRPDRRAWEVAIIRRPWNAELDRHHPLEAFRANRPEDTVYHAFVDLVDLVDLDLGNADPIALRIGRFHERHPRYDGPGVPVPEAEVMWQVEHLTRGAVIVGAVVNFGTETLAARMRAHGLCPAWDHHLLDVEAYAAGAAGMAPPWDFKTTLAAYNLTQDEATVHTASGDAAMVQALYDAVKPLADNAGNVECSPTAQ